MCWSHTRNLGSCQDEISNTKNNRRLFENYIQRLQEQRRLIVEVGDSQTGYLLPARDGPGALPDVESSWDAVVAVAAVAAVAAVSCQNVTLISFSFRAGIGLI